MGNFMVCGKLCDNANASHSNNNGLGDMDFDKVKKEVLVSNLLLKIDYLEERLKGIKDDMKDTKLDIQYDLRELKNNVIILIKLIN